MDFGEVILARQTQFLHLCGLMGVGGATCKNRPPQHLLIHCVVSMRGPARKATEPVAVYEAELGNISLLTLWRRLFDN